MKTKLEIIEETANFYNSYTRAYDPIRHTCVYNTPEDLKQCAVDRCLIDPKMFEEQYGKDGYNISSVVRRGNLKLDDYLKEEYRGHGIYFWRSLQEFHDDENNWNENGLSDIGIVEKNRLIQIFSSLL